MLALIRPAGPHSRNLAMNLHHLAHPHTPSPPTLICLHSSGSTGGQWKALTPALSGQARVVTPDLLGYASDSRWPVGTPVSLDLEARNVEALLPESGAHLFGHSYGGAVALQIALRRPEQVASLTLYEPVRFALLGSRPETAAGFEAIIGVGRSIGLDVISGSLHAAGARFVDYWAGDVAWAALDARRRQLVAERMPKVQAEFEALFADRVPAAAYHALTMPVALLGGTRSPLPARQVLDVLAAQIPHASRAVVEGAGHLGPISAPVAVVAHLPSWMTSSTWAAAA
jgi:pimeloyl-ACP methyl ester carboxylesterase